METPWPENPNLRDLSRACAHHHRGRPGDPVRNESMDALISSLIDKNVASNQAAEELETLLQQKG